MTAAQNASDRFCALADKLFRAAGVAAKEIRLLNGRTFNATFTGPDAAEKAARAIAPALRNVRVAPGFDLLKTPVASGTTTRRETPVWRVHGTI